jgi:hypothetical protein
MGAAGSTTINTYKYFILKIRMDKTTSKSSLDTRETKINPEEG